MDITDPDALGQISMRLSVELNKIFMNSSGTVAEVRLWLHHLPTVCGVGELRKQQRQRADPQLCLRAQEGTEAKTNAENYRNVPKKSMPVVLSMNPSAVGGSVQVRVIPQYAPVVLACTKSTDQCCK